MMKHIDQNLPHSHDINEGWAIHVYGRNRRLLCTFGPSHCWSLLAGLALGIVLSVSWVGLIYASHQSEPDARKPMQAPLSVD